MGHPSDSVRLHVIRAVGVLALGGVLLVSTGCDDDPTGPPPATDPWSEVQLPVQLEEGSISDLAFGPTRNLVLGYRRIDSDPGVFPAVQPILMELEARGWTDVTPEDLGSRMLPLALTLVDGAAVIVGADGDLRPLILDERGGWTRISIGGESFNAPLHSVLGGGGVLRSVGTSQTGLAYHSSVADEWSTERTGFETEPNDKGLTDLAYASGTFYGVGFDDAGPPFRVLMRNDGDGWVQMDFPPALTWNLELEAVAATAAGALWVGGAVVEPLEGGGQSYRAWLVGRGSDGDWFEVVLPQAEALQSVNDVLVASDETIYLACGIERTGIVRASRSGSIGREGPELMGRLRTLEEDSNGVLYASGYEQSEPRGPQRPLLLRRRR